MSNVAARRSCYSPTLAALRSLAPPARAGVLCSAGEQSPILFHHRQYDHHSQSFSLFTLSPDTASVHFNNGFGDGEAET